MYNNLFDGENKFDREGTGGDYKCPKTHCCGRQGKCLDRIDGNPVLMEKRKRENLYTYAMAERGVATGNERPYARARELGWLCY